MKRHRGPDLYRWRRSIRRRLLHAIFGEMSCGYGALLCGCCRRCGCVCQMVRS